VIVLIGVLLQAGMSTAKRGAGAYEPDENGVTTRFIRFVSRSSWRFLV